MLIIVFSASHFSLLVIAQGKHLHIYLTFFFFYLEFWNSIGVHRRDESAYMNDLYRFLIDFNNLIGTKGNRACSVAKDGPLGLGMNSGTQEYELCEKLDLITLVLDVFF